jgi:hypothetical protein
MERARTMHSNQSDQLFIEKSFYFIVFNGIDRFYLRQLLPTLFFCENRSQYAMLKRAKNDIGRRFQISFFHLYKQDLSTPSDFFAL